MKSSFINFYMILGLVLAISGCTKKTAAPAPTATITGTSYVVTTNDQLAVSVPDPTFSVTAGEEIHLGIQFTYSDGTQYIFPGENTTWSVNTDTNHISVINNDLKGFIVGTYTLQATLTPVASGPAVPSSVSKSIQITASTPDHISIISGDAQVATVATLLPLPLVVEVFDVYNNPVPNTNVLFSSTQGQVTPAQTQTDTTGEAKTNYVVGISSGQQAVVAQTGNFVIKNTTFAINANADVPYQLSFQGMPTTGVAGQVLSTSGIQVVTQDKFGNTVTSDLSQVTISPASDSACLINSTGNLTLSGSATETEISGVANYTNVAYSKSETVYLRATANALRQGCSSGITISPNAPAQLLYIIQPGAKDANETAGVPFPTQPVVSIDDSLGNLAASITGTISLAPFVDSQCSVPDTGVLTYTPPSIVAGLAVFTDVTYAKAESFYLQSSFTLNGTTFSKCSNQVIVAANNPAQLVFDAYPAQAIAGTNFAATVAIKDSLGNYVANYTKAVTLAPFTDSQCRIAGTGKLTNPAPLPTLSAGKAIIQTQYPTSGSLYIKASTEDFSVCSASIPVLPNTPIFLSFINQPGSYNGVIGKFLTLNPAVAVKDFYGNTVSTATGIVSITPYLNAGCLDSNVDGVFTGNPVNLLQGIANFTNLTYNNPETIYLKATYVNSAGTTLEDCSNPVNFNPDLTNVNLTFQTQPGGATVIAGQLMPTQPVIAVTDNFGNPVTPSSGKISLAAYSNPGCSAGFIAPGKLNASPVAVASGLASFTDVFYAQSGTIYLQASFGSLSVCSSAVQVGAASIAQIAFSIQPQSVVQAGTVFPQFELQAQDSYGNVASIAVGNVKVTAYANSTCTVLSSSSLSNSSVNAVAGVADFNTSVYTTAETIYLKGQYTDGSFFVSSSCSSPVIISPSTPTGLLVTQAPSSLAIPNVILTQQPILSLVDVYGNVVKTNGSLTYSFYSDTDCTVSEASAGQSSVSVPVTNGISGNPNIAISVSGSNYLGVSFSGASQISECLSLNEVLVLNSLTAAPARTTIAANQTEPLLISGGEAPYTCSIDSTAFPAVPGYTSSFAADCSTYTAGVSTANTSAVNQRIVVKDSLNQKTTVDMVIEPLMTGSLYTTGSVFGTQVTQINIQNSFGLRSCSNNSSLGSTILNCQDPSNSNPPVGDLAVSYSVGANNTGLIQNEIITITDSLNQQVNIPVVVRPNLQMFFNYNPTALSECEADVVEEPGGNLFTADITVPVLSTPAIGQFFSDSACSTPITTVTIKKNTSSTTVYYKGSPGKVGFHNLSFGSTLVAENYQLKMLNLPSITISSNGSFVCTNGGITPVTCPTGISTSSGYFYTDGIVSTVLSQIPVGTTQITLGSAVGFIVGQTVMITTSKTTSSDTSRVGNAEFMIITAVNANVITVTQIKTSGGTTLVQDGTTDYVQALVVPRFVNITINGAALTANAWTGSTNGIFALSSLKTITGTNSPAIYMDYKGFSGTVGGNNSAEGVSSVDSSSYGGGGRGANGGNAASCAIGGWGGRDGDGGGGAGAGQSGPGAGGGGGQYFGSINGLRLTFGAGGGVGGYAGAGAYGCGGGNPDDCGSRGPGGGAGPGANSHGGGGGGGGGGGSGCNFGGSSGSYGNSGGGWSFDPSAQRGGGIVYLNSRNISGISIYSRGYGGNTGGGGGDGGNGGGGNGCDSGCAADAAGGAGGGGGGGGGGGSGGGVTIISQFISNYTLDNSGGTGGQGGLGGCSGGNGCGCEGYCAWGRTPNGGTGGTGQSGASAFYFSSLNGTPFNSSLSGSQTIPTNTTSGFGGQWNSSLWIF
jgi:hypothetical protein